MVLSNSRINRSTLDSLKMTNLTDKARSTFRMADGIKDNLKMEGYMGKVRRNIKTSLFIKENSRKIFIVAMESSSKMMVESI